MLWTLQIGLSLASTVRHCLGAIIDKTSVLHENFRTVCNLNCPYFLRALIVHNYDCFIHVVILSPSKIRFSPTLQFQFDWFSCVRSCAIIFMPSHMTMNACIQYAQWACVSIRYKKQLKAHQTLGSEMTQMIQKKSMKIYYFLFHGSCWPVTYSIVTDVCHDGRFNIGNEI